MKILMIGTEDPARLKVWSGIPYHLALSLRRRFHLVTFGGVRHLPFVPFHLWNRLEEARAPGKFLLFVEPSFQKTFAALVQKIIVREKPDVILAMGCDALAYLSTGLPTVTVHDATFRQLNGYYAGTTRYYDRTKRYAEEAQQRGLDRTTLYLPSSEWARQSACRDYHFPPERAHVLPLGANLQKPPSRAEIIEAIDRRIESPEINFFFAGVDWTRKGGDTAVRIVAQLIQRGIPARLHVAGCHPPPEALARPFLANYGFLAKSDPVQAAQLRDLFQRASFLILPSLAECYGCVFCEANAYGVPVIARDTGGVSSAVREGVNGYLLSSTLEEDGMVQTILALSQDRDRYRQLALRSRDEYENRLNWDTYTENFEKLVVNL